MPMQLFELKDKRNDAGRPKDIIRQGRHPIWYDSRKGDEIVRFFTKKVAKSELCNTGKHDGRYSLLLLPEDKIPPELRGIIYDFWKYNIRVIDWRTGKENEKRRAGSRSLSDRNYIDPKQNRITGLQDIWSDHLDVAEGDVIGISMIIDPDDNIVLSIIVDFEPEIDLVKQ